MNAGLPVMLQFQTVLRNSVLGLAVLSTACTSWFWPTSRSRGHLFDEAGRGAPTIGDGIARQVLDYRLSRGFPPGTPMSELMPHIQGADVTCSGAIKDPSASNRRVTVCKYNSRS